MTMHAPEIGSRELPHVMLDGIMRWSVYSDEKDMFFNGHAVRTPEGVLIMDPPSGDERIFSLLLEFGSPIAVLLLTHDHERASNAFRQRFGLPIAVNALDAPMLSILPEKKLPEGYHFPGGWEVIHLRHQKSPGESALYNRITKVLILGDALIGKPAGQLNMLPDEKYLDPKKALEGLHPLQLLDVDVILPGDGEPILEHGNQALRDFFVRKNSV